MEGGPVDVVLLRRAYALRNAGLAIAVAGALLGLSLTGESRIWWLIALLFSGGIMAMLGIDGTPRRVAGRLDALGVRVADRVVARRRSFRVGWIERDGERTCVYVHGFPPLRLEAKDVADARKCLRLLGLDRSQTVLRFPTFSASVWGQFVMLMVLQLGSFGFRGGLTLAQIAMESLFVFVLGLVTFLALHDGMVVGADGVLVGRPLRRRFVPFSKIRSVDREDAYGRVVVRMRDGTTFRQSMTARAGEAALEAIQSSLAAVNSGRGALRDRLRRTSDEDAAAWMARLRALATPAPYRTGGLAADALWQVVDDPGASASERAAAAAALDVHATPDERQRLREAAARMASPQVRVAIERVAARGSAGSERFGERPREIGVGTADEDDGQLTAAMARVRDG